MYVVHAIAIAWTLLPALDGFKSIVNIQIQLHVRFD